MPKLSRGSKRKTGESQRQLELIAGGLKGLGDYPDGRVRWLIGLTTTDLGSLSDQQWAVLRFQVRRLAESGASITDGGPPGHLILQIPGEPERRAIAEAVEELRDCLINLASRRSHTARFPAGSFEFLVTDQGIHRHLVGPLRVALTHAAVDLISAAGALRLRFCPYMPPGTTVPCAKVFLAERRQKFCISEHSRAAAWQAWLERRGGTRSKYAKPQRRRR